jgi:uncharacterized protein (TIGR03437 family)
MPTDTLVTVAATLKNSVTVTIGGKPAQVPFAGLTESGLDQINVTIPADLPEGDQMLVANIGGVQTQANIFITIQK